MYLASHKPTPQDAERRFLRILFPMIDENGSREWHNNAIHWLHVDPKACSMIISSMITYTNNTHCSIKETTPHHSYNTPHPAIAIHVKT